MGGSVGVCGGGVGITGIPDSRTKVSSGVGLRTGKTRRQKAPKVLFLLLEFFGLEN